MKVMVAFEERVARVSVYVPEHLLASPCDAPSVTNLILNAFKSAAKKQYERSSVSSNMIETCSMMALLQTLSHLQP